MTANKFIAQAPGAIRHLLGQAIGLPLEWSSIKSSTLVGSSLDCKYWTRVEVTETLAYNATATIMAVKIIIVQAPELDTMVEHNR